MARRFRLLLICLIMLTVPLQGVSAAVMTMSVAKHSGPAQMTDCHSGMAQSVDHSAPEKSTQDSHNSVKLKVCSSCCTGAILNASLSPAFAHQPGDNTYLSLLSRKPAGFIPDGLERPPRALS